MRALIIEDEQHLLEQLGTRFRKEGYAVDTARDGEEGLHYGLNYDFDIAIIDLGLPKVSGLEVIKQLRQQKRGYPILILTARGRWQDKVEGLEGGADDYLTKPFHIEELLARTKVLMRRSAGCPEAILHCDPVKLNLHKQTVTVSDIVLELTAFEYKVLEYLMLNRESVISKTTLTEHIYEQDFDRDSNVIEVFIGRLRRKLDPDNQLKPIETLRGRGYRFTLPKTN